MLSDQMNFLSDQMDFRQTGLTFIGKTDFAKCDVRTSHHNVTYVHVCHICQDMTYVLCHILSTVTPVRHTKTLTSVRHICQNVMDVLYIWSVTPIRHFPLASCRPVNDWLECSWSLVAHYFTSLMHIKAVVWTALYSKTLRAFVITGSSSLVRANSVNDLEPTILVR